MNKKGFELATNFLVVIILSLVLFGTGIAIFTKMIDAGKDLEISMSERMKQQLDAAMDDGSLIVIPTNSIKVKRGDTAHFSLGFWNEFENEAKFTIDVEDKDVTNSDIKLIKEYPNVEPNEKVHVLIAIKPPKDTPKGQYAFDISIKYNYVSQEGQLFNNILYTNKKNRIYVVVV